MKSNYHIFQTRTEELNWRQNNEPGESYISYIESTGTMSYGFKEKTKVGQFLHSNGKIDYKADDKVIGVCVIPEMMLPDKKARFMSLVNMSSKSDKGTTKDESLQWCTTYDQLNLDTQYTKIPWDNSMTGTTFSGSGTYGYLPSDHPGENFTVDNPKDPGTKYHSNAGSNKAVSPFTLTDGELNPLYVSTKDQNNSSILNPLTDFGGSSNTRILSESGYETPAADACSNFAPGYQDKKWYLPAMGELGFMMVRLDYLNMRITEAIDSGSSGVALPLGDYFWSSSEYSQDCAWFLYTGYGIVGNYYKSGNFLVRAFLRL